MRIIWWNVQRLGVTTDEERRRYLDGAVSSFWPYDVLIMCELTTRCVEPPNIHWNYRKKNEFQLCYGIVAGQTGVVSIEEFTPAATPCYTVVPFKGGKNFKLLTSRTPGLLRLTGLGTPIYFFHAPASNKAVKTVAYLACDLNARHGNNPWVLIGDFNVEPDNLAKRATVPPVANFIKPPPIATHNRGSKLDYALSNINGLTVTVGNGYLASDHQPILVSW